MPFEAPGPWLQQLTAASGEMGVPGASASGSGVPWVQRCRLATPPTAQPRPYAGTGSTARDIKSATTDPSSEGSQRAPLSAVGPGRWP